MLADRHYMREPDENAGWPPVKLLLVVLITIFFAQCILQVWMGKNITQLFGLSVSGLSEGRFWQIITYQFLHAAPWPFHILGNCIGIYFLGNIMQEVLGKVSFYKLYFGAGTLGGLVQVFATVVLPGHVDVPVVGASAGVFGLMGAFATMFPEKELTMWFYFLPLQIKAKHLFWGAFALSLFGTLFPYSYVADSAHFGGLLAGFAFARLNLHERSFFSLFTRKKDTDPDPSSHTLYRERPRKRAVEKREVQVGSEDFISKEVDPILDKISAKGIHSLTEQERKILDKARSKMAKK